MSCSLDNDIAEIDANAKPDASLVRKLRLTVDHPALHFNGAAHSIDDAGKLSQQAVAGIFDDAAPVLLNLGMDMLPEMCLKRSWVPSSSVPIRRE
jgi:hypothetical protein